MKFLVTNDDGIDAPGLSALVSILENFGTVVVVAPAQEQSGVGHSVTSTSFRIRETGENRFSVEGRPADCTRAGLKHIVPDADWVVAGINPGANLGSDVYNSGTVAAAREGAILDCPAMAVSQYIARNHRVDWEITTLHAAPVIRMLLEKPPGPDNFWNINLPHPLLPDKAVETAFCPLDTHPHAYRYRREGDMLIYEGVIHDRPRDPERDVAVCFGGRISVTRIPIGS